MSDAMKMLSALERMENVRKWLANEVAAGDEGAAGALAEIDAALAEIRSVTPAKVRA